MNKAEELAGKAYPIGDTKLSDAAPSICRNAFIEGYHQAEKDLELSWKDMEKAFDLCYEVLRDVYLMKFPDDKEEQKEFYQEVLKRFKDFKERKEKWESLRLK